MLKKQYIEELLILTKLQTEALEEEDMDEFNRLLEKRQYIIDHVEMLHHTQSEAEIQNQAVLMAELKMLESSNQQKFQKQLEEVKAKLREIRQMRKHEAQYINPYDISREEGVFFDKKERC